MEEEIRKFLHTKTIGRKIIFFSEIDSTQLEAKRRIENEDIENGTMIVSDRQSHGRGTHERKWYTGKGENIAFTIALFPSCTITQLNTLTIDIANCMIEVLKNITQQTFFSIKHPNDIMIGNKKIGGILTEVITQKQSVKQILIGIGMNVNSLDFPEEIEEIATSLKKECGQEFSRGKIIANICNILEEKLKKIQW